MEMDSKNRPQIDRKHPHCSNCGRAIDPFRDTDEGYTRCCNEPTCYGDLRDRYACGEQPNDPRRMSTPTSYVFACCNATADETATARGVHVLFLDNPRYER